MFGGSLVGLRLVSLWVPNLIWHASHSWPQLELSTAIAAGSSGTSAPRWLFVPFQLVLVSPLLVPVWAVGLCRLARDPALRTFRAFTVAYVVTGVEWDLPPVYSGHNSYWQWGPPPENSTTTIAISVDPDQLRRWFGSVELAARNRQRCRSGQRRAGRGGLGLP